MGHPLVQHLTRLAPLCAIILSTACIGGRREERVTPPPPKSVAYVSPAGLDTADGTEAAPLKTITRALEKDVARIVLLPGAHPEPRVDIHRPVIIEGQGGTVVLRGHVFVDAQGAVLRRLSVGSGLAANFAEDLRVESATISAGPKDDAVSLTRSSATLVGVKVTCGPETCLSATTSTAVLDNSIAVAATDTKRVLRFEQSVGRVKQTQVRGGSVTQIQAGRGSKVEVLDTRLVDGSNGLAALQGASVSTDGLVVEKASKTSVLAQGASLRMKGGRVGSTPHLSLGISGGQAELDGVEIDGSAFAAISVTALMKAPAKVRLKGGLIRHGSSSAITIGGSEVAIDGTRFVGDPQAKGDNDAVVASGVEARLRVAAGTFEDSGGFAIGFYDDAAGSVTATITGPKLGGVMVQNVRVEGVRVEGAVISGCRSGAGMTIVDSIDVTLDRLQVSGCKEGGIVAGKDARVKVRSAKLIKNGLYGAGAFGGATLRLEGVRISGSKSATFASCGDGARIVDGGGNAFRGPTSACP